MDQQPPDQIQSELESFRRQWREEVSSRSKNPAAASSSSQQQQQQQQSQHQSSSRPAVPTAPSLASRRPPRRHEPPTHAAGITPQTGRKNLQLDDEEDYVPAPVYEGDGLPASKVKAGQTIDGIASEPKTALDFYEHAVERESTGKLGDSLQLYRKAFRMDDAVDRKYRDKHFAGRWAKPAQPQQQQINPSNAAPTVPNTAHHSRGASSSDPVIPLSFADLIASFAGLEVEGAPPPCEGVAAPPCPIAALPDEILLHVLRDVAVADVADFARLSQVCKRLAYLVMNEDQIWRRVCLGHEFGFSGMHQHYQRSITWEPLALTLAAAATPAELEIDTDVDAEAELYTPEDLHRLRAAQSLETTLLLHKAGAYPSWQAMFRHRPRVRFGGCYISTVNYIRPGQNAGQHLTWNTPVHIVTYYRYLRLFRDGTAISLTTTDEPAHVVHHLRRENMPARRHGPAAANPAVMAAALKGRWRLVSSPGPNAPAEVDLCVETEGVGKYVYRMDLSFRSAGRAAARNNKLVWRGFWSYNRLTDDWAQFALKNDKPFFFSRVRSFGVGE